MNLRFRLLLLFAAAVLGGMAVLYFLTRSLLLNSFQALEIEQIKQNLDYAALAVNEEQPTWHHYQ